MLLLKDILKIACDNGCSDIYMSAGTNILGRIDSNLQILVNTVLNQQDMINYARDILGSRFENLETVGEHYSSFSILGIGRFRVNIFKQRSSIAMSIKIISMDNLNGKIDIPHDIYNFISKLKSGLVLIIGSTKHDKSLVVSSMIDKLSSTYSKYIITIESAIDILYKHNKSIVNQREVGTDTDSYISGIDAALKENPDILIVDDIPNYEVLKLILKCCDAGILVIAMAYSNSTRNVLEYLTDIDLKYTSYLRSSLSNLLRCIVNQRSVAGKDNTLHLFEFMINTPNIANCIKENNIKQIEALMQNSIKFGMYTLDMSLINAYKNGKISRNTFIQNISNRELAIKIILNY